ncbi:MAG: ADP-ribosylation factor-like protein [Promethearchaeota archaeon]
MAPEGAGTPERKKVLVMGLDKCGKSSIILTMSDDRNLLSYYSLRPTQGLKIEEVADEESRFYVWELGGQESYRREHLENLYAQTEGAEKIIFVVDSQDLGRYELAFSYFEGIAKVLVDGGLAIPVTVFFHKYDPHMPREKKDAIDEACKDFAKRVVEALPRGYPCRAFKTSIFTKFRKLEFELPASEVGG